MTLTTDIDTLDLTTFSICQLEDIYRELTEAEKVVGKKREAVLATLTAKRNEEGGVNSIAAQGMDARSAIGKL